MNAREKINQLFEDQKIGLAVAMASLALLGALIAKEKLQGPDRDVYKIEETRQYD